jgi:hypothetical protein
MGFGLAGFAGALGGLAQTGITGDPMDVFGQGRASAAQTQLNDSILYAIKRQSEMRKYKTAYRDKKRKENMTIKEILQEETDEWLKDALK